MKMSDTSDRCMVCGSKNVTQTMITKYLDHLSNSHYLVGLCESHKIADIEDYHKNPSAIYEQVTPLHARNK